MTARMLEVWRSFNSWKIRGVPKYPLWLSRRRGLPSTVQFGVSKCCVTQPSPCKLRVPLAQVTEERDGPNGLLKALSSLVDSENWFIGRLEETQPGKSRCVGRSFVTCPLLPYTSKHLVAKSIDQLDAKRFIPLFCRGAASQAAELRAFVSLLLDRGLRMCVTLPMLSELKNWILLQEVCETDVPTWNITVTPAGTTGPGRAAPSPGDSAARRVLLPPELKKLHQSMASIRESLQSAGPDVHTRFQPSPEMEERVGRDLRDVQSDADFGLVSGHTLMFTLCQTCLGSVRIALQMLLGD